MARHGYDDDDDDDDFDIVDALSMQMDGTNMTLMQ